MLSTKILELRNKAHEASAANKIIDMLDKLRKGNNDSSKRRWIWELIQNAKDAVNSSNLVNIAVNFDEVNGTIVFKHNGKLFTTENIVFLIEQVSSKDRQTDDVQAKKTVGKFGTGFLTTHLLSEKVRVSGLLQDDGEDARTFAVDLDRTGRNKQTIIDAIHASCMQLDEREVKKYEPVVDPNAYNTCFAYTLDSKGIEVAKQGLENLIIAAPYVLAFVPEINCITINDGEMLFQRGKTPDIKLNSAYVLEVQTEKKASHNRYVCVSCDDDVKVAVEIGHKDGKPYVCEFDSKLPKLFCDFPLVGTEDFAFPIVVNSSSFNPTEPRDGIWLNDSNNDTDTEQNKDLITRAIALYKDLLKYTSECDFDCIYNITAIKKPVYKNWLSVEWLNNNVIEELKNYLSYEKFIIAQNGIKTPLFDDVWESNNIMLLMSDASIAVRDSIWVLSNHLYTDVLCKRNEVENWYKSLWRECHNFGLKNLVENIERFCNVEELENKLSGGLDVFKWLNQLYSVIFTNKVPLDELNLEEIKIFPNQDGQFCALNDLMIESGIDEVYKTLAEEIGINIAPFLSHKGIETILKGRIKEYTLENLLTEVNKQYDDLPQHNEEFCLKVLCLRLEGNFINEEHEEIFDFVKLFYPSDVTNTFPVSRYSKKLLSTVISYWLDKIIKDISSCKNFDVFSMLYGSENEMKIINDFVSYLIKYGHESQLNLSDTLILPNQNGVFVIKDELFIDADDIDDLLKDILLHTGDDIRQKLLHKDILLKLPDGRTIGLSDVADKITKFVEENATIRAEQDEAVRTDLIRLFNWLREDTSVGVVKKHFSKMRKNIHWFYNDDDIASNMEKADKLDSLLVKYGITNTNDLEELLKTSQSTETVEELTEIKITKDLLAQYGLSSEDSLKKAIDNGIFGANFVHTPGKYGDFFSYVQSIIARSKENVTNYLSEHSDYDLSDIIEVAPTIYVIKKYGQEIYLIIRPSDNQQVIIYYESEFDMLDYEKDWELWVEDGISDPQKLTFGKILKLTGMNKIPLKKVW